MVCVGKFEIYIITILIQIQKYYAPYSFVRAQHCDTVHTLLYYQYHTIVDTDTQCILAARIYYFEC